MVRKKSDPRRKKDVRPLRAGNDCVELHEHIDAALPGEDDLDDYATDESDAEAEETE